MIESGPCLCGPGSPATLTVFRSVRDVPLAALWTLPCPVRGARSETALRVFEEPALEAAIVPVRFSD